jgi:N-acetylglucosamine-6-phosphate deacetylase
MSTLIDENYINCITGQTEAFTMEADWLLAYTETAGTAPGPPFVGPGLIDLQVNGIMGIDFNSSIVSKEDFLTATLHLLSKGVTTFFPTIITNSDENILRLLVCIREACEASPLVNSCIGGIHLEGPFISPADGAIGAHDKKYVKAPDWELFKKFQNAAGGKIKVVTLAPEWDGSYEFIASCINHSIIVSIGHSLANPQQICNAVRAGARLSTHLGNGVPLLLPRHPNIIWEQLATEQLYTCIIGDGIHLPDSFIKVVIKNKGDHTILVSDATCFAGMAPGEYNNHIGGNVLLNQKKRLSLKNNPDLLAGAAKSLLECIEYLVYNKVAGLSNAWQMASANVSNMLAESGQSSFGDAKNDFVIFQLERQEAIVLKVIKNRQVVFEK